MRVNFGSGFFLFGTGMTVAGIFGCIYSGEVFAREVFSDVPFSLLSSLASSEQRRWEKPYGE